MDDSRFSILDSRFPEGVQSAGPLNSALPVDSISAADGRPERTQAASNQVRPPTGLRRRRQSRIENRESGIGGFTLIEVLVAILIVASVAIVLIYRRIDVVRDAGRVRDERIAWTLAALKLGDLSRDPTVIQASDSGDFEDDASDFGSFRWSYESQEEPVPIDDEPTPDEQPRVLRRIKLKIFDAEDQELQSIEAMFPAAPAAPVPEGNP